MWSCGGDSGTFCPVHGAGGGERAVWGDRIGSVGGDIALQREDTGEGGEKHCVVGGNVEGKKRNGPTNAGTCTSVVQAHRGADKKALPAKNHHNFLFYVLMHNRQQLLSKLPIRHRSSFTCYSYE